MTQDPRQDSKAMTIDDKTRTELEAAVFRRLVDHLRAAPTSRTSI